MTSRFLLSILLGSALPSAIALAEAPPFTSPRLPAVTSWIGNSYGGVPRWVQQDVSALTVTPDGTVFTNVPWEEGGGNVGEYRDGELIRHAKFTHGWGNNGGDAVAANSRYLYIAMEVGNERGNLNDPATWPPKGSKWYGISRRTRADIGKGAPFPGGKGGKGATLKEAFLVVAEPSDQTKGPLPGACADEQHLYVTDPYANQIKVYDAETMQLLRHWPIERAGPIALHDGHLWLLERKTDSQPARLLCLSTQDGKPQQPPLTFDPAIIPLAFCFAPDGRLLIADDSSAQVIRFFSRTGESWKESGTFGEKGGVFSGTPGAFADRKLNHVTAIGCDAKGHLYLAHNGQSGGGGTVLESYRLADSSLQWRLLGLTFVDMASVDPENDTEVFTKEERFQLDYTRPPGQEARYQGFTLDRFQFPNDPRLHIWSANAWVRRIGGQRILMVTDMNSDHLQVYRFAPQTHGEIAIPSGLIARKPVRLKNSPDWPPHQPAKGEWIWRDTNGNGAFDAGEYTSNGEAEAPRSQGLWVDFKGNVWLATETNGIRFLPSKGLDNHGNPQWDFATMQTFPHPAEFQHVKRLRYDAASDTLYLGGTTKEAKNQHWKPMGPIVARYDGWLHGKRTLAWCATLPYAEGSSGHESCEPMGFDIAGDFLFAPYTGAAKKLGIKTGHVEIFRTRDGSAVGHLEPSSEVGEIGLQDIRETLTAHRRADGEYLVMIEDDYKSKVVLYRLRLEE